jgi:transmembrane sensor
MSGAREWQAENAGDLQSQAAQWILRRQDAASWSARDQEDMETWAAQSAAHRVAYLRLEAAWTSAIRLAALNQTAISPAANGSSIVRRARKGIAAAAMGGVIALAGAWASYFLLPHEETFATPVGGHRTVALQDGSKIELNTDTALRVVTRAGQRTAWLDHGEAYFQIRHNGAHPFTVMAAGRRVTDIGTEFLVRLDPNRFEVVLVKGRAQVDTPGNAASHGAMLTPGSVAVAANTGAISVTRASDKNVKSELGWRRGVLVFYRTTLATAADEFNRYNREQLVIADPSVARLTINGTLSATNPQELTRIAQDFFGLRVFQRGDVVVISR